MIKTLLIAIAAVALAGAGSECTKKYDIEVYENRTKKDVEQFNEVLEQRKGTVIIEIVTGEVLDEEGNGRQCNGYYIHYNPLRFNKGDTVKSVFVYEPETNFVDDIISRTDTLVK